MGTKLKIKDIEGDSDAITELFKASDCQLSDYLELDNRHNISFGSLLVCITLFTISSITLWLIPDNGLKIWKVLFIFNLVSLGASIIAIQKFFKEKFITVIAITVGIVIVSLSINLITPKEAVQKIDDTLNRTNFIRNVK